ncbi:MAG: hypothetical protein QOK04_2564 [Solirubrobacteraceae bacterium]|nr:hypothetical protein [Solirubrobacteraceae bacterium]
MSSTAMRRSATRAPGRRTTRGCTGSAATCSGATSLRWSRPRARSSTSGPAPASTCAAGARPAYGTSLAPTRRKRRLAGSTRAIPRRQSSASTSRARRTPFPGAGSTWSQPSMSSSTSSKTAPTSGRWRTSPRSWHRGACSWSRRTSAAPACGGGRRLHAWWRRAHGLLVARRRAGSVLGPALYPAELAFVRGVRNAPSTELAICRRRG